MFPRFLARAILRLGGWRAVGDAPTAERYVVIAAPHTSNWDFLWAMAIASALGVRLSWLGKDSLFRPPFGALLRRVGGISVDRSQRSDMVSQLKQRFAQAPMGLIITVEGTRGYVDYWRSGFYHIARGAGVPVVIGLLDYRTQTGGFGSAFHLTGDVSADMDVIRAACSANQAKYPGKAGRVRLREEDAPGP